MSLDGRGGVGVGRGETVAICGVIAEGRAKRVP